MTSNDSNKSSSTTNQPRNLLVTDATQPYKFTYLHFGKPASIIVNQTAEEETWPGGALWDIGVLLSHAIVGIGGAKSTTNNNNANFPPRLIEAFPNCKDLTILELGCGVGLTGLVAAAALGTKLTILTDLKVVVDDVTEPNVIQNTTPSNGKNPYRLTESGKRGRVMSMPLCWGDESDEEAVAKAFETLAPKPKPTAKRKKGKKVESQTQFENLDPTKPDLIIIGDVAYQHKPGAPSHFDVLLSTLLKFLGPQTLVIFGTRMRMPASMDLLEMFLEHMEEIVQPPIEADEIDSAFGKFKHQITIHVFRKKIK